MAKEEKINPLTVEWEIHDTKGNENWEITTKRFSQESIGTASSESVARYIVELHNYVLPSLS